MLVKAKILVFLFYGPLIQILSLEIQASIFTIIFQQSIVLLSLSLFATMTWACSIGLESMELIQDHMQQPYGIFSFFSFDLRNKAALSLFLDWAEITFRSETEFDIKNLIKNLEFVICQINI